MLLYTLVERWVLCLQDRNLAHHCIPKHLRLFNQLLPSHGQDKAGVSNEGAAGTRQWLRVSQVAPGWGMGHKHTAWEFGGGEDKSWAKPLVMGPAPPYLHSYSLSFFTRDWRRSWCSPSPNHLYSFFYIQTLLTLNTKPITQGHRILFFLTQMPSVRHSVCFWIGMAFLIF